MDRRNVRPFHQPEELLSLLEDDPRDARGIYETFVREGPDPEEQDPWTEQGLEPVRKVAVIESLT
jgi:hypothetical protein